MRILSEHQQARQDLILEALREQQQYERSQRAKTVRATKIALKMVLRLSQVVAYIAITIMTYKLIINLHI
tara:strand:- start:156 stop:365 length:210 start_codon:yes stop_codon:yes gene_type:complete